MIYQQYMHKQALGQTHLKIDYFCATKFIEECLKD